MADKTVMFEIGGGIEVTSTIETENGGDGHTRVWCTSSCDGVQVKNHIVLAPNSSYSADQFEYDIEQARFGFAVELAGKVAVARVATSGISDGGQTARLSGPVLAKPNGAD